MTRASDADRERALRSLQRHYAAGRLDAAELEDRAGRATRARSRGELRALFADLPRRGGRRATGMVRRIDRAVLRLHAGTYAAVNGGLVGLWALTGGGEFWPAWTMVPWGVALGGHAWGSRTLRSTLRPGGAATRQKPL